ncbi:MAG: hypothetical protein LBV27_02670 [Oscillospiraceae bacterium]|jgi:DNA-directed RNA polymerase subunit RPC12/RpoP|nr:hypothetical protein [Oscillospiraceae bacterium]
MNEYDERTRKTVVFRAAGDIAFADDKRGLYAVRKKISGQLDIEKYTLKLKHLPTTLLGVRYCIKCGAQVSFDEAVYCPVCGVSSLIRGRSSEMVYKRIRLNENGKAIICPHCSNEELTPGDYCMICGSEIVNHCADMRDDEVDRLVSKGCRTTLPGNARFCYKCGNESTFYQRGWLKDWRSENTRKAIENINVAVDFDDIKKGRTSG